MKKLILAGAITLSFHFLIGQNKEVDAIDLVREVQIWKKNDDNMKLVWWIPTEYWGISTKGNPNVTEQVVDEITKAVENYILVAAIDGNVGAFGFNYADSIKILLIDNEKTEYSPLEKEEISQDAKNIIDALKPSLSTIIGPMGENMNFYLFPAQNENGNNIINAAEPGSFSIQLNNETFNWRLPLGALVPPKFCPNDNQNLSGNWIFCPWHGSELKN